MNAVNFIGKEIKAKELKGLAKDRAQKKMESVIKALRKDDPDAAAIVNDAWTKVDNDANTAFYDLSAEEEEFLIQTLMQRRMEAMLQRKAA